MIKNLISIIIIILGSIYIYQHNLFNINELIKDMKKEIIIPEDNEYKKDIKVKYVQNTDKFIPDNKQELLNIYYTIINSGWDTFTFYCGDEYTDCIDDVKNISSDNYRLSHLNSFVHPYNSYSNLYTTYYNNGKITIEIKRNYTDTMIKKIDKEIDIILNIAGIVTDNTSKSIKKIHDYLIMNSKYDTLKIDDINDNTYRSNIAYGPLFEGYAVCSGYTDVMALFLEKLNIPNMKIATNKHVWNLIFIDNKWLHLDLTWNTPITDDEQTILLHTFFLIDTNELMKHSTDDHQFNLNIYELAK